MEKIHDLKCEERLIKLLGYKIKKDTNENTWLILDKDDLVIGNIKYKKLINKDKKKDKPAIFGYKTTINNSTIKYEYARKESDDNQEFVYDFQVTNNSGKTYIVTISISENYTKIHIRTAFGTINFETTQDYLKIDSIFLTEKIKKDYYLKYTNKEYQFFKSINDLNIQTTESEKIDNNHIKVIEKEYKDNKLINELKYEKNESIEDFIKKDEMGIAYINQIITSIYKMLPFKKEFITEMLSIEKNFPFLHNNEEKRRFK